jgi:hypothetical protein
MVDLVPHLNVVFALQRVEPFIFDMMRMQRRPGVRQGRYFEHREGAVRILSRNFHGNPAG